MAAPALTILHLAAPARVGGLEKVVAALAVGHARRGHHVHVAAVVDTADAAAHFLDPLADHGVRGHPLVLPSRAYLAERKSVRSLCERLRPTAVHTHGYRADVNGLGIAASVGAASVSTVHGFTGGSRRNRLYEHLQIWAFRRIDAVVAVSRPLADLLDGRGVSRDRLHVVPNAWSPLAAPLSRAEARRQLGIGDSVQLAWLGRLTHEKGADVLLRAVPALPPQVRVSFIGDGRERPALTTLAGELGVADRIDWHGLVPDAGRLLPAFDGYILSSRTEGTPIALFEAMAARIPIVATRVGGVPDVVGDAEALLVPSEEPLALAAAVKSILDAPQAAMARAAAAADRLEQQFGVAPWLDAYETVYRTAVTRRGHPRR
jgi:glycosyltransferase involved in cell wall biosynthesis